MNSQEKKACKADTAFGRLQYNTPASRQVVAKEAAPKQQLDTQKALVQQINGTVISDQAALDNAQLRLSYTRVVAPISGMVGLK